MSVFPCGIHGPQESLLEGLRRLPQELLPQQSEPFCALLARFEPGTPEVTFGESWENGEIRGQFLRWNCGYGPDTGAVLVGPATRDPLAAVLMLHDHAGVKWWGKEKLVACPGSTEPELQRFIADTYDGLTFADRLAQAGYLVLVHDTFLWGSRRLAGSDISDWDRRMGSLLADANGQGGDAIAVYNAQAHFAETTTQKVLMTLGLDLASVVYFEDTLALRVLKSLGRQKPLAVAGHSGGGIRAAMLKTPESGVRGFAVAGMLSTDAGMSIGNFSQHTWMLFASRTGWLKDWPATLLREKSSHLFVLSYAEDELFETEGMQAADRMLRETYSCNPGLYQSTFLAGPHYFGAAAQNAIMSWLTTVFSSPSHHP